MNEVAQTGILVAVVTAISTGITTYLVQSKISTRKGERNIRNERITKLLLPLYIRLMNESAMASREHVNEDGCLADFYHDLPLYYEPLVNILEKNLYLADTELTQEALRFINWVKVSTADSSRWTKLNEGKLNDKPLEEFRKCVYKKYEHEKKIYNKYTKIK